MQDFPKALRLTLPILAAYWFLGITYGLLASSMGYDIWIPVMMAMLVFSGSVEFTTLTILAGEFHPLAAMVMALMVGARHLFYGITMLDRYRGAGWKKPLLVFWMADEAFAINYANKGSHTMYLWVSFLDWSYWVTGAIVGYLLGANLGDKLMSHLQGLDFVVTAMLVSIFMDDYLRNKDAHASAWLGIGLSAVCLMIFGPSQFIIPTMLCILAALYNKYRFLSPENWGTEEGKKTIEERT